MEQRKAEWLAKGLTARGLPTTEGPSTFPEGEGWAIYPDGSASSWPELGDVATDHYILGLVLLTWVVGHWGEAEAILLGLLPSGNA